MTGWRSWKEQRNQCHSRSLLAGTDTSCNKTFIKFSPLNFKSKPRMWQGNETHRGTSGKPCSVTSLMTRLQRYEEFFAKSRYTGIFRYGISLTFSSQDFLEIVRNFLFFFFIGAVSDQFKEFPKLLGLLYIRKLPKNFFVITINIIISGEK